MRLRAWLPESATASATFAVGDRVVVFHHIPCMQCFYCRRKVYAQCPTYKKVGVTAGFEPAGGGFAQYVRVMDWIVRGAASRRFPTASRSIAPALSSL